MLLSIKKSIKLKLRKFCGFCCLTVCGISTLIISYLCVQALRTGCTRRRCSATPGPSGSPPTGTRNTSNTIVSYSFTHTTASLPSLYISFFFFLAPSVLSDTRAIWFSPNGDKEHKQHNCLLVFQTHSHLSLFPFYFFLLLSCSLCLGDTSKNWTYCHFLLYLYCVILSLSTGLLSLLSFFI